MTRYGLALAFILALIALRLPCALSQTAPQTTPDLTVKRPAPGSAADNLTKVLDAQDDNYVVPFTYDPITQPHIMFRASINGGPTHDFIFDTGASPGLSLDTWAAKECKAAPNGQSLQMDFPRNMRFDVAVVRDVVIAARNNELRAEQATVGIIDMAELRRFYGERRVAGIFGANFLRQFTLSINFATHTLTFDHKPTAPFRPPDAAVLPLEEPGKEDRFLVRIGSPNNLSPPLLLDTGATGTSAPRDWVEQCRPMRYQVGGHAALDGALRIGDEALLTEIWLGRFNLHRIEISETVETDANTLGMDLLSRFLVTLDFRNHELILQRGGRDPDQYPRPGWTGLTTKQEQRRAGKPFRVSRVEPNSPAQQAGVQANDMVVSVDEKSVAAYSKLIVDAMTDGWQGQPLQLTLKRNGSPYSVTLTPSDPFDLPVRALAGVRIYQSVGQPLQVLGTRPETPAAQAGLMAGDEILQIDRLVTSAHKEETIWDILHKDRMTLLVRRKGQPKLFTLHLANTPAAP